MIIENEKLLDHFRAKEFCEYCQWLGVHKRLRYRGEPHHIKPKGMGGGSRLDIAINILTLGGPWDCAHHVATENGKPPLRSECLKIVAAREHCTVVYIVEECARILRLDKHAHLLETTRE